MDTTTSVREMTANGYQQNGNHYVTLIYNIKQYKPHTGCCQQHLLKTQDNFNSSEVQQIRPNLKNLESPPIQFEILERAVELSVITSRWQIKESETSNEQ